MKYRGLFLILLLPFLGSCAANKISVGSALTDYYAAKPTVASYADMTFAPLTLPTKQDFEINEAGGAFKFEQSPSFYKAFALPETDAAYEVVVGSYSLTTDCYPCKQAYFYQKILLLDGAKTPIEDIPTRGPEYVSNWSTVSRLISASIPAHSNARYLLVYTTRELVENGESRYVEGTSTMIMVSPGVFVPISSPGGNVKSLGSPIGRMSIEVKSTSQ